MTMTCGRCQGLMVQEYASSRERWILLWACLCCGERMDETIRFNRLMRRPESRSERHRRLMREMQAMVQHLGVA